MSDAGTTPERARAEALIHEIAIAAADNFVVTHCRPDHIDFTQGALLNLGYTIKDAIRQYLSRAAQGAQPLDTVLAIFDNFYAPDDAWAQACRKQLAALGTP